MPSSPPTPGTTDKRFRCRIRTRGSGTEAGATLFSSQSLLISLTLLLAGCPSLLAPHDPQGEARRALEGLSRTGLEIRSTPHVVRLTKIELSEIEVDGQDPPTVLFHVVATGTYGKAALGYYGGERVTFGQVDRRLLPPETWFPKLEGVLHVLVARDAALAARNILSLTDLAAPVARAELLQQGLRESSPLAPFGESDSLSIRIDGDQAELSSLSSAGSGRHVASLQKLGDSWRFTSGLL